MVSRQCSHSQFDYVGISDDPDFFYGQSNLVPAARQTFAIIGEYYSLSETIILNSQID